jgi:excisionase family DNA binding protein
MSTAQAAEYLKVSPRTVRRLVDSGKLTPMTKLPGRTGSYVFDEAVVMAYLTLAAARKTVALWAS